MGSARDTPRGYCTEMENPSVQITDDKPAVTRTGRQLRSHPHPHRYPSAMR